MDGDARLTLDVGLFTDAVSWCMTETSPTVYALVLQIQYKKVFKYLKPTPKPLAERIGS